jgi:hypothetical protein
MSVVAFVQTTNRQEIDGAPGLQVIMSFRMEDQVRSLRLEGIVSVSEEFTIGEVQVTLDEMGLGDEVSELFLKAGACGCWKAIFEHDRVAAGFSWRALPYWVRDVEPARLSLLGARIEENLTKAR